MNSYYEMEAEQKSNSRRLRQFDRKQTVKESDCVKEKTGSFSLRMIITLLILSVTILLKQVQMLDQSTLYMLTMAELQKDLTIEDICDISKVVADRGIQPVMNWIEEK